MSQRTVVLLLGSNIGDKKKILGDAVLLIEETIGEVIFKTDFFETIPVEFVSLNYFINFAVELKTIFSPERVLVLIKNIERKLGRELDSRQLGEYSDRLIDIDIVSYNDIKYKSNNLIIPHESHLKREFSIEILKKLNEIKHNI